MVKLRSEFPCGCCKEAVSRYTSAVAHSPFLFIQKQLKWHGNLRIRRYCVHLQHCEDIKLFIEGSQKE